MQICSSVKNIANGLYIDTTSTPSPQPSPIKGEGARFNSYSVCNNKLGSVGFGSTHQKLIAEVLTKRPKQVNLTDISLIKILESEGFIVSQGKKTHFSAKKEGMPILVWQTTNGSRKFIDPKTIAQLQTVLSNHRLPTKALGKSWTA